MKIQFRFNSKSSGQNIPEAIRLAEKHNGNHSKLYFNLFDEDDPTIQEQFEKFKSLETEKNII